MSQPTEEPTEKMISLTIRFYNIVDFQVRFQKHSFLLVLLNISSSICQNQGHCARNAAKKTEVVRKASKRDKVRDENTFGIT
jgi:hypothetical protein